MKSKELGDSDPWSGRNFVLVLNDGEEAFANSSRFPEEQKISGASFTAIGAFKEETLVIFDFEELQGDPRRRADGGPQCHR